MNLKRLAVALSIGISAALASSRTAQAITDLRPTLQPTLCNYTQINLKELIVSCDIAQGYPYQRELVVRKFNEEGIYLFAGGRLDCHGVEAKSWSATIQSILDDSAQEIACITELVSPTGEVTYIDQNIEPSMSPSTFTVGFDAQKSGYSGYRFRHVYFLAWGYTWADIAQVNQIQVNGLKPTVNPNLIMDCSPLIDAQPLTRVHN